MSCVSASNQTRHLLNNCAPNGVGLYEKMFSIRLSDILSTTTDVAKSNIITGFTLKTGAKFRIWEGFKLTGQRTTGFEANDYGNRLPQTVRFAVMDNSADADLEVNSIVNLTDLVIVTKQNGINGRWKVNGYPTGLTCTSLAEDSNDTDNPGGVVLTFTAATAREMAFNFKHTTSGLDDTETYLTTLST